MATILFLLLRLDCNDGLASYCETIIKGLKDRGDSVVIVSGPVTTFYGSSQRRAAIADNVVDWIILEDFSVRRAGPGRIRRILAIMRGHAVDVISPQGLSLLPVAFVLSLIGRRPVVANFHPSMGGKTASRVATARSARTRLAYWLTLTVFKPTRLIAISREIFEFFTADCQVNPDRVVLIGNGIDDTVFRPPSEAEYRASRAELRIPDQALVCVLTGRLNLVKGHDVVIDAVRMLRRSNPALRILCLFVGGGDQADEIKSRAFQQDEDFATFRFLGFLPDAAATRQAYWAADIGLLPSRFEGFGLAIAEAMSCGCVPIRTPGGGWQDQIVDGTNGFIVPFNDPNALADRILDLAEPGRRAEMRNSAIAYARQNLGQTKMVEATSDLYRSVAR